MASDCKGSPNCLAHIDLKEVSNHYPNSGKYTAYRLVKAKVKPTLNIERRESVKESNALILQINDLISPDKPERLKSGSGSDTPDCSRKISRLSARQRIQQSGRPKLVHQLNG